VKVTMISPAVDISIAGGGGEIGCGLFLAHSFFIYFVIMRYLF